MKLYYFNPNTYGEEAFVCASSLEEAKQSLLKLKKEISEDLKGSWSIKYDNEKIDRMLNCVDKYTIDEFEIGEVVFSEIS